MTGEHNDHPSDQKRPSGQAYSEEQRSIAAERFLLDDSAALEDLVEEAADEFQVDRAAVRIVTGAEQHTVASTMPARRIINRSEAVCRYTILLDDGMVVDDLTAHPEFADSPVVQEDGMQWYAGAPIAVDGHTVGTFCIENQETGADLLESERQLLHSFAERAATVIAFRHYRQDQDNSVEEAVAKALEAVPPA